MIEVAIMIEGQDGLTWPRWQRIARLAEDLGFVGLFRSDHFTNARPPDKESLELWVSLTWLASHTQRLVFGPLVTPMSFRHPVHTARMAAAVDDLSDGRLILGLGAGWQDREHEHFGFQLLDEASRFRRFEEGVQVITRLLRSDEPVDFQGEYYRLQEAILLPRPKRPGGPPILVGGNGVKRSLPMAARYATHWNGVYLTPAEFARRSARLDELLRDQGRDPSEVHRSVMTGIVFGRDEAELKQVLGSRTAEDLRARGAVAGTPGEVVDQLGALAEAGVQRVMLQWLRLDDMDRLEALGQTVLPQVQPSGQAS